MSPLAKLLDDAIRAAQERDPTLSQAEIARRAGLHEATLSRALHGIRPDGSPREVSEAVLLAVAAALGLEVVLVPADVAEAVRAVVGRRGG